MGLSGSLRPARLRRIAEETGCPLAMGENLHTIYEFQKMIAGGGVFFKAALAGLRLDEVRDAVLELLGSPPPAGEASP